MKSQSNKQNTSTQIKNNQKQQQLKDSSISKKSSHNLNSDPFKQSLSNISQPKPNNTKNQSSKPKQLPDDTSFGSNLTLDYQNAKFQGRLLTKSQGKTHKVIKAGLGILMDDDLNFLVSNWKNDSLNGKTMLITRYKNYIYGRWNNQKNNPSGTVIFKIGTLYLVTKFDDKTGKWNMIEREKNVMLIYDDSTSNLLVLGGKIQQTTTEYKCSKTHPLSVVQFVHFQDDRNDKKERDRSKGKENLGKNEGRKDIIRFYCKKYGFNFDEYQLTLCDYLKQITNVSQKCCNMSKKFAMNVSKNLISQLQNNSLNQKQQSKQVQTYESQKNKLFDNNCIVFKQFNNPTPNTKETFTYFGFLNGLGIKFSSKSKQSLNNKDFKNQSCSFKLKSMGIHNLNFKIQDIGVRFYDNKCIEQGNFKTKNTFTYEDVLFRPTNKLFSIYNKYHKQEANFVNEYFDKGKYSIFKILANFEAFANEHITYILNQCHLETTKFQQKQQRCQLVNSILALKNIPNAESIDYEDQPSRSKGKRPKYEIKIERKSKSTGKQKDNYQNKESLTALKTKNNELKEKIKKIKYEIEYEPVQNQDVNVIIIDDDKIMSKLRKHLSTENNNPTSSKSISGLNINKMSKQKRSRSKSQLSCRPQQRKSYIQKQKQKILSSKKNTLNDDSLQKIDGIVIKKVHTFDKKQRQKTQAQKLLQKINENIGYRQKFNSGIEYHVDHESFRNKNKKSPQKNKYNGRQRLFTDNQLDNQVKNSQFSAEEITIRSITPGVKSRKKEQYRHYIYSNVHKNINDETQKYENQKQIEQSIRAEISGMSLKQYRQKNKSTKDQQFFMDQKFLQIIDMEQSMLKKSKKDSNLNQQDPNQTFGILQGSLEERIKRDKQLSMTVKQRLAFKLAQQKYFKNSQKVINPIIFAPRPREESLVEKRMRILQEYKRLNDEKEQEQYMDRRDLKESQINITLSPSSATGQNSLLLSDKQYGRETATQKKRAELTLQRLPIYQEKMTQKVLSPLRTVKHDFSMIQGYPQMSAYLRLQKADNSISKNQEGLENRNDPIQTVRQNLSKNTRKYHYYFDR